MPAAAGIDNSPMRMPVFDSMNFRFDSSCCEASNSFFASSETNFTVRSPATKIDGTPETTSRLTTDVIAGDADSIGNAKTGAFGNGSSSTAGAVACTLTLRDAEGDGAAVGGGVGGATFFGASGLAGGG